jgi:WD40 repeat protein
MLAFSQSGNKLAALSEHWQDRSDYLEVWDLVKGERILSLENLDSPWNPYFSPDESQLFVSYAEQGIEIYDLVKPKLFRSLELSADWHAYSPDGKYFALGEYLGTPDESTISVVDQTTEQELFADKVPGMVMKVKFSPDSDLLIGGFQGPDHIRDLVWKISTQELVADLIDYDYGPIFSPDNSLAATSKEGKVYIFSTEGWVLRSSYGFADPYTDVKPKGFSQGGDVLAVEDRNNIVFLEAMTGEELYVLPGECDTLFSPKGTTLITWCYQGEINIWGVIP